MFDSDTGLGRLNFPKLDLVNKGSIAVENGLANGAKLASARQIAGFGWYGANCGSGSGEPPMVKRRRKPAKSTKKAKITSLLLRSNGATLAELSKSAGWQYHSVRGFMSGTLKKKLGFRITSHREDGKPRRYFIARGAS